MPILLTTPFNPGAFDPGHTYPRAKIITFFDNNEQETMRVSVDFGDVVEGNWESGSASGKEKTFTIQGEDYDALMVALPEEGETVYESVKRLLYDYLIANVSELAGVVE